MKLKPVISLTTAASLLMLGGCFSTDLGFAYDKDGIDTPPIAQEKPELTEVAEIDVSLSQTPQYTFNSTQAGSIQYSGACSSTTDNASAGENTISFEPLAWNAWYKDCEITVEGSDGQISDALAVSDFRVIKKLPLNDTGIDFCADDSVNYTGDAETKKSGCVTASNVGYPNQDAHYGRDFQQLMGTLPAKVGGGAAGFDYTRLRLENGELVEQPADETWTQWDCVRDNVTGLLWEVKQGPVNRTKGENLHDPDDTYRWYNPDASTNGGHAGSENVIRNCYGYNSNDPTSYCNTSAFAARVNNRSNAGTSKKGLCGFDTGWRVPTQAELRSIIHAGQRPSIDTSYFGATRFGTHLSDAYWSSTPYAYGSGNAWSVRFQYGNDSNNDRKSYDFYVRLVRSDQ